jgi:hypothetical protein
MARRCRPDLPERREHALALRHAGTALVTRFSEESPAD